MANHCYNYARVTGAKDSLDRIEAAIKKALSGDVNHLWWESFKKVFDGIDVEWGDDTYDEFGSKWFDADMERESDNDLIISGDSAWSPVSAFFLKLSKYFNVEVESEYEESGCDFGGWFECKNGDVTRDDTTSWLMYCDINDPGRAFEVIMENIQDGVWESYNEWIDNEDNDILQRLSDEQTIKIKDEFKRQSV